MWGFLAPLLLHPLITKTAGGGWRNKGTACHLECRIKQLSPIAMSYFAPTLSSTPTTDIRRPCCNGRCVIITAAGGLRCSHINVQHVVLKHFLQQPASTIAPASVCCIKLCSGIMFLLCASFTHASSAEDEGALSARRPARRGVICHSQCWTFGPAHRLCSGAAALSQQLFVRAGLCCRLIL